MLSRSLALFAVLSLATAIACSDSRNTGFAPDSGAADGGSIKANADGGGDGTDSGSTRDSGKKPPVDSGEPPPPSCSPGSVAGFTPQWLPPTTLHQAKCSAVQITTLIDCYFNANASQATCDAFDAAAANKACITCSTTPSTSAALGPMVISANDNLITLNVAGCIARTSGQVSATGCGAKVQAARQCASAACETNCPVPNGDAQALTDRNKCQADAQTGVCGTYQSDADTCSQPLLTGSSAACANGSTFEDLASSLVTLFCGN